MTRSDLIEKLGSPDGPMRLLRRINSNNHMIAGSHICSRLLIEAGFIRLVEKSGRWKRFAITDLGLEALNVEHH